MSLSYKMIMTFTITLTGCTGGDKTDTADALAQSEPVCDEAAEVPCVDQIILDLALQDDKVSEGAVDTSSDGTDFITTVDARAGGMQNAASNPWVYVKFTESGAEKVEIDDETALEDMGWDLSLKRFNIRLNSGSSGPSCVGSAALSGSDYDSLSEAPSDVSYELESFYTEECSFLDDGSGLENPALVLSGWWTYPGCVATSMIPHVLQLADGSLVKLVVEEYYGSGQDNCNSGNGMGSDSALITFRWSYLN